MMSGRHIGLSAVLVAILASCARLQAQEAPGATGEYEIATAPVELDATVLFRVRGVSSYPAAARARVIQERIVAMAGDPAILVDSLRAVDRADAVWIVAGAEALMAVYDADAILDHVTRTELAAGHLLRLRQAITDYRAARSAPALRRSAVNTLIATAMLALTIGVLLWFWRRLDRRLMHRLQARIHAVEIQSFELMQADRIWAGLRSGLLGLRTTFVLALGLVYLGYVLAEWPWTRGASRDLVGFALGPLQVIGAGIVTNIPNLVFLTVLFFVVRLALKLFRLFFEAVGRGAVTLAGFDADWAQPTYKIIRIAVVAFALIVAYPYIPGSESAAFKGVSLFLGILFSLGSSSAVSNIIAGYMLTYRRAFKAGDRVKIGDAVGDVIQMRLQVTHLRSYKNEEIVVPNSQILAGNVLNYSSLARAHGLILHTEVGIGYETPWRQVEGMLLAAADRTPGLSTQPRAFVLLKKLGDFAVTYELNVNCDNVKAMNQLYTALHRNILDLFNEYGVQIMTPAYECDPAEPKVVPPKDWYAAPASARTELAQSTRC